MLSINWAVAAWPTRFDTGMTQSEPQRPRLRKLPNHKGHFENRALAQVFHLSQSLRLFADDQSRFGP